MSRAARLLVPLLAAVLLAGCSEEGGTINAQMREGDQKGYVAGDGSVESLTPDQRTTRITLGGTTLEDEPWTIEDHAGTVVVVNVWGSWCGPCIAETPDLEQVASEMEQAGEPVQFVGVNSRDSVPSAQAFQQTHDVSYPSLQDDGGRTRAQLGSLAVATPTTLVVDGEGRLAARVSGQVEAATLRGLIEDVLAGEPGG